MDRITNDNTDIITRSQNLESIQAISSKNQYKNESKIYFIDEFELSDEALNKYEKELAIKEFANYFEDTNELESNARVIKETLSNKYSIDDDEFLEKLISNKDFLNDIFKKD